MPRLDRDFYFMTMAQVVSLRTTCARRSVGAVLVNQRYHVLATGFNGPASGVPHCIDVQCPGATAPSGTALDACEAIHAEQNALLQCKDVYDIYACYTTAAPCAHCLKLLMNTSCKTIYYSTEYPGFSASRWMASGPTRTAIHIPVGREDAAEFLRTRV